MHVHNFCWLNFDEPAKVMHVCEKLLVHYFCWLNFDEPAKVMHMCVEDKVCRYLVPFELLVNGFVMPIASSCWNSNEIVEKRMFVHVYNDPMLVAKCLAI